MNFWDSTSKRKILRRCSFKQESGFWLPWVRRIWDKSRSGDFHKTIIIESPLQHGDWETESVDGSQRHGQIAFRYIGEYCGSIIDHPCKSWSSSTFGAQKLRSPSQAWYSWRWFPDICQWLWHTLVNPSLLWDSPLIPVTPWYMPIPLLHLPHFPNQVLLMPWLPDEAIT